MDYPGLNLPHGKAPPDWLYYPGDLGDSDLLTIVFGYSPDPAQARAAARQAASRGHVLGTDEDAHAADSLDPLTQTWDLGADPLAWARDPAKPKFASKPLPPCLKVSFAGVEAFAVMAQGPNSQVHVRMFVVEVLDEDVVVIVSKCLNGKCAG